MSKNEVLAKASLDEIFFAKVNHRLDLIDTWIDKDPENASGTMLVAAAALSLVAAGTEVAANLFKGKEDRNKRLALHAGAIASLASAGVATYMTGIITGENAAE